MAFFVSDWALLDDWYDQYYRGKKLLVLRGIADYYRDYGFS